jgi:hypothetical protein
VVGFYLSLRTEFGVSYNKRRLHKVGYFQELLTTSQDISDGLRPCCGSAGRRWCVSKR